MFLRIILLCFMFTPALSQAKQLSHTYKSTYSNFKVIKGFDNLTQKGKVSLKPCPTCAERVFTITAKTFLAENGVEKPIDKLLEITLKNKTKHVLIQVNKFTDSVYYIEWGYPEGETEDSE